jgi:hypothetical protein
MADAPLVAALGARGMGKSAWVTQYLAKPKRKRQLVFDTKQEHGAMGTVMTDPAEVIKAMKKASFRLVFRPTLQDKDRRAWEFDLLCKACMAAKNMTFLVEELAFFTKPGYAPEAWQMLTLLGRHDDVEVIGTAQRPASIDKDFLGNCTTVHAARLPFEDDARLVARTLGCPFQDLMTLKQLEWVERSDSDENFRRGMLKFRAASGSKPKAENSTPPE